MGGLAAAGGIAKMSGFGKQHESKPVYDFQKATRKIHLAHRAEVDKMKPGSEKDKAATRYDLGHAADHLKNYAKVVKKASKDGIGAKGRRDLLKKMLAKIS